MYDTISELRQRIKELELEFESKLDEQQERFRYELVNRKIKFQRDIIATHRKAKVNLLRFIGRIRLATLLTLPFIYGLIIPLVLLDVMVTIYQAVCFRVYGIKPTKRGDYVVIDRQHLAYLNSIEKINCMYCGYANGLLAFAREVASRTEQFWCPIKHARRVSSPHARYWQFADYGDVDAYRNNLKDYREKLS